MSLRAALILTTAIVTIALCTGGGCGGGGGSDPIYIPPAPTGDPFPPISGALTTVPAGDYIANGMIIIQSGEVLVLEPGVTIYFDADMGIEVWDGGTLVANGSDTQPITMTANAALPTRGFWRGIYYDNSYMPDNVLNYVTIEFAGGWNYTSAYEEDACIMLDSSGFDVGTTITNCTIRQSAAYGIYMDEETLCDDFGCNTVTENALGAVWAFQPPIRFLDCNSTFSGNDLDRVWIQGDYLGIEGNQQWDGLDVPYVVDGLIGVEYYGHLTIRPGATLEFRAGAEFDVADCGALTIAGIESQPVLLTGTEMTRGHWNGVYFSNCDNISNIFTWTTIEYAGGSNWGSISANVTLDSSGYPVRLLLSNCTLRECSGYGLYCDDEAIFTGFTNNTITANTLNPVFLYPELVEKLTNGSTYSGNVVDSIYIEANYDGVYDNATWKRLNVPYYIDGVLYIWDNAQLTIRQGTTLVFKADAGILVEDDGQLTAQGTSGQKITFTGETAVAGTWRGINFENSDHPENILEHCIVEYAGGYDYAYATYCNICLTSSGYGSSLTLSNCTIQHSAGWGVWKANDSTISPGDWKTQNTWFVNALGNYYEEP
ncbi:MAG: hypothetical protein ACYS8W_21185 [Planctomycetota bacterium]|jgi:hypothetical protein